MQVAGRFPLLRLTLLGLGVLGVASSGQVPSLVLRLALIGSAVVLVGWAFHLDNRAANRLFPSQPLSLKTSVGIASWIFLLFGITTSQATVFMPLIVHVLYGVSLLKAGYITALLSMAWTIMALYSASLLDRWVRVVIVLGPLVDPLRRRGARSVYHPWTTVPPGPFRGTDWSWHRGLLRAHQ